YSRIVKRPIECAAFSYKIVTVHRVAVIVAKLDPGIVPDSCYSDFTAVEVNNITVRDRADFFDCFHTRICLMVRNSVKFRFSAFPGIEPGRGTVKASRWLLLLPRLLPCKV